MIRSDGGGVTAEFAVALPAVGLVLGVCVWGVQLAGAQVRLQDAAGIAARAVARGDAIPAPAGLVIATWREGGLACASASASLGVALSAESCAPAEG